MNRPKNLDKYYGWCRRKNHGVILNRQDGCYYCKCEKQRKREGKCIARLSHGPGHQSHTYCEMIGPHKIHRCQYGEFNEVAYWAGSPYKQKCTGSCDNPPTLGEALGK